MMTRRVVAILAAAMIAGCATIMEGKTQKVTFNSVPSGADVYLNGKHLGKTPLTVTLDKPKEDGQLKFSKEGYKDIEIVASKKMSSWLLGNIIFGGTFGTSTDYASGAIYEYQPNNFQVTLEPKGMSEGDRDQFSARNELRRFILMNYDQIAMNVSEGQGEYLQTLMSRLNVDAGKKQAVLSDLRGHLATPVKAPAFASYVITRYGS